jgi:hypothetical protein
VDFGRETVNELAHGGGNWEDNGLATVNGCVCSNLWSPGDSCEGEATYSGCNMATPCNGDNGGVCGRSWCQINQTLARNNSCQPHGAVGGWDYCTPPETSLHRPFWAAALQGWIPLEIQGGVTPVPGSCVNDSARLGMSPLACMAWCEETPGCSAVTYGASPIFVREPCSLWRCNGSTDDVLQASVLAPAIVLASLERHPDCCVAVVGVGHETTSCIFPFRYNESTYTNCTTHALPGMEGAWCASAVDGDRVMIQPKACECTPLASLPSRSTTTTMAPTRPPTRPPARTRAPTRHHGETESPSTHSNSGGGPKPWHLQLYFVLFLVAGSLLLLVVVAVTSRALRKRYSVSEDGIELAESAAPRRPFSASPSHQRGYSRLSSAPEDADAEDDHDIGAETLRDFLSKSGFAGGANVSSASSATGSASSRGGLQVRVSASPCESGEPSARSSRRGSFSNLSVNHVYEGPSSGVPSEISTGTCTPRPSGTSTPRGTHLRAQIENEMVAARPVQGSAADLAAIRRAVRHDAAQSRTTSLSSIPGQKKDPAESHWSALRSAITSGLWKHKLGSRPLWDSSCTLPAIVTEETPAAQQWDMLVGVINDGIAQRRLRDVIDPAQPTPHASSSHVSSSPSPDVWHEASTHD